MRFEKPYLLASLLAFIAAALGFIAFVFLRVFQDFSIPFWKMVLSALAIGAVAYPIFRVAIGNFIYEKVKIIYKNIHDLKVAGRREENQQSRGTDLEGVTRDVSEWAEKQRDEIEDLMARETFRREFIGNVSHELKTPIFNIQGYLLTLLDGALDEPEINRKYLKRANKSVDRMINIVEDLETIANLEANRVRLTLEDFDIVELVRETFEILEDLAQENRISMRLKKEPEKPILVKADRQKIGQVLINLLSNAVKYGQENGMVEVRFYDMHQQILTEISDDGIGIPEEDVPRVFERFYRVDKSRSREAGGTGLGLSIVKHILEAHKQAINLRSSEDAGSTFSFTLKKAK